MKEELQHALDHALVAAETSYHRQLAPTLITNNDLTLGDCLNNELATAETFILAVAFISEAGLLMLKTKLADLALQGVRGQIITSTYLGFNQPKVFKELLKLKNVDVLVVDEAAFHIKAYYIQHKKYHTVIIGSGNLTANALKTNLEWNVKLNSLTDGAFTQRYLAGFEALKAHATPLTQSWIDNYADNYQTIKQVSADVKVQKLQPNLMQEKALDALRKVRLKGDKRALIVSATGTGKTYLAAFDVQKNNARRVLFIAHREQLLMQAQSSFKHIFGSTKTTGIFSGHQREKNVDIVFATIQTMSKHYQEFANDTFDYIIIDETHRAKADSYQMLFDYFNPEFLLGVTATPERMDGFNVYELFDYNLAYEISLKDALDAEMLAPFNYIGVADYSVDDEPITDLTALKYLVADERIKHLITKTNYYGYSGNQLKGLIFVSRVDEGEILAQKLTLAGIPSQFLSGKTTMVARQAAVTKLEQGQLKYLIAVDIFNEGIDIPSVNQIVMMRGTQSKIVFLQQLGRGLRKAPGKEYLTVIDFIGNYQNNYLIPQAFEDGQITDKDQLRMKVLVPQISGLASINFEKIAAQKILTAVTNVKLDRIATLKNQFSTLKIRLGRIPTFLEVYESQLFDLNMILTKFKSYPEFSAKMIGKNMPIMAPDFKCWLQFVSQDLILSKRRHELLIIQALLKHEKLTTLAVEAILADEFTNDTTLTSIKSVLGIADYFTVIERRKYGELPLIKVVDDIWSFYRKLNIDEVTMIRDAIQTGIGFIKEGFESEHQLTLYQKYRRKDVVKNLNWQSDLPSIDIGGYKYDSKTKTLPVFITLQKSGQEATGLKYENSFIAPNRIPFYSKGNRTLSSPVESMLYHAKDNGVFVPVFVKKSDDEGAAFYYIGPAQVDQRETKAMELINQRTKKVQPVVRFELILNANVPHHLLDYLVQ